jgi:site-specific DNA-cytosine methylase
LEKGGKYHHNLKEAVLLWPTPTANDAKNSLTESQRGRDTLTARIVESLWPTPRAGGMCGGSGNWEQLIKMCGSVEEARKMGAGNGGQLNADWVERLMGYPDRWTDIDTDGVGYENRYPAAWLDGSWDTIPRLAGKRKNRRQRLKALGNAIVPQVAAYLWGLIGEALWQ